MQQAMTLPTCEEINPYDDLDGRVACKHFFGRSLEEAVALFRESDIYYQEALMWMGAPAFRFYLPAVFQFIRLAEVDSSGFVSHFASTLEYRLENEPTEMIPIAPQLAELCGYIIENWSRFSEGAAAYGDVRTRYETLCREFSRLCPST